MPHYSLIDTSTPIRYIPISSTMQLAQALKGYRKKTGMSQGKIGAKAGLLQKTVSTLERMPDTSKIESLFKLLSALNLEIVIQEKSNVYINKDIGEW